MRSIAFKMATQKHIMYVFHVSSLAPKDKQVVFPCSQWFTKPPTKKDVPRSLPQKIRAVWSIANANATKRKMRLTSRDEGGGRGGGGKEEEGGVDELHFYLGLGLSWTIKSLDCEIGGSWRQQHATRTTSLWKPWRRTQGVAPGVRHKAPRVKQKKSFATRENPIATAGAERRNTSVIF